MSPRDHFTKLHLLIPLRELYGELSVEKESHYLDAFKRYTDTELKSAFVYLRDNHEYARCPSISDIHKAIRASTKRGESQPTSSGGKMPWDIRADDRAKLVKDYLTKFRQDSLYFEAAREGWDLALGDYIIAVGNVQAQMLIPGGGSGIGVDSTAIFGVGPNHSDEFKRKRDEFMRECRQQCQMGQILVTVPDERINHWKAMASYLKPQTRSGDAPIENKQHIKKQLDSALENVNSASAIAEINNNPENAAAYQANTAPIDAALVF